MCVVSAVKISAVADLVESGDANDLFRSVMKLNIHSNLLFQTYLFPANQ